MGRTGRLWFTAAVAAGAPLSSAVAQAPDPSELYRIRIANRSGGAVEVSANEGQTWDPIGKVVRPASAAGAGNEVLTVVPGASVVGVNPDRVQLRLPSDKAVRTLDIFSKSETATAASIATDIPTRGALFRSLAPAVGSRVLLQREGSLGPVPAAYVPKVGDVLLIQVPRLADKEPPTITLENKVDGEVVLSTTGGAPKLIAKVKQPLRGVGRYSNTERSGSGTVVAWSPLNVLISTSGVRRKVDADGKVTEERGGFVIQPVEPGLKGATNPASQMLLEGVPEGETKTPVSRFFGLPVPLSTGDPLDATGTRVEVRLDDGEWEPFPDLRGSLSEAAYMKALQDAAGPGRTLQKGITHMRFRLGTSAEAAIQRRAKLASLPPAGPPQRGRVTISANVMGEGIKFVAFFLDGEQVQLTNLPPYAWEWNTVDAANGEHLLEIRGMDDNLVLVNTVTTKVIVDN